MKNNLLLNPLDSTAKNRPQVTIELIGQVSHVFYVTVKTQFI
ncbi:protein of unknown function [Candidatus Nitrotoga arctica]|uniref:Uncharacterized protein n=1 Tax=Candidatus Nitrotoga arctica TaxID=453162 RepID=A0ABN8ALP8_9PROT|nr:protein of unknown function [Candidatus Nitrotoga arctica]